MAYNMKISQKEETITRDEMHHLHTYTQLWVDNKIEACSINRFGTLIDSLTLSNPSIHSDASIGKVAYCTEKLHVNHFWELKS